MSDRKFILPFDPSTIPDTLKRQRRWLNWRADAGVPLSPIDGRPCNNDSSRWGTFEQALAKDAQHVGLALGQGYSAIDLDAVMTLEGKITHPLAEKLLSDLERVAFIQKSPSGLGAHILLECDFAPGPKKTADGAAQILTSYLRMTGVPLNGGSPHAPTPLTDRQRKKIHAYIARHSRRGKEARANGAAPPCPQTVPDVDYTEMVMTLSETTRCRLELEELRDSYSEDRLAATRQLRDAGYSSAETWAFLSLTPVYLDRWAEKGLAWLWTDIQQCYRIVTPTTTEKKRETPLIRLLTPEERVTPAEPPAFLVEEILAQSQGHLLVGHPKSGKSFTALSMAAAVAAGTPWLGMFHVEQMPVLYIAGEALTSLRRRLHKWYTPTEIEQMPLEITASRVNLETPDIVEAMQAVMHARHGDVPFLVIVDTLNRNSSGRENDAEAMAGIIATQADIEEAGLPQLWIHHLSKTETVGSGRGHSSIAAGLDNIWNTVNWTPDQKKANEGSGFTLRGYSARDYEIQDVEHHFRLTGDTDDPMTPPTIEYVDEFVSDDVRVVETRARRDELVQRAIVLLSRDGEMSQRGLEAGLEVPRTTLGRLGVFDALEGQGCVEVGRGARGSVVYRVSSVLR